MARRRFAALTIRTCRPRHDRRARPRPSWMLCVLLAALASGIGGAPGLARASSKEQVARPGSKEPLAGASSKEQMRGLDEQVQEIKSDVLGIAAELDRLEEKLLYPSNTQVAVFVSLAEGEKFRLDSVQIQIDGELVAHHIYSQKELEALQKGGVQRIYTGNVATGDHRLQVSIAGKRTSGGDLAGTQSFGFTKDVEPKLVGITLASPGLGDPSIQLGPW